MAKARCNRKKDGYLDKVQKRKWVRQLSSITEALAKAFVINSSTLFFKVDLTLPNEEQYLNVLGDNGSYRNYTFEEVMKSNKVIGRFFHLLGKELTREDIREKRVESECHHLGYVWVREFTKKGIRHYHCLMFINGNRNRFIGDLTQVDPYDKRGGLCNLISHCWLRALGLLREDSINGNRFAHVIYFPSVRNALKKFKKLSGRFPTSCCLRLRDIFENSYGLRWLGNRIGYSIKRETKEIPVLYKEVYNENEKSIWVGMPEYSKKKNLSPPPGRLRSSELIQICREVAARLYSLLYSLLKPVKAL